MTLIFYDKNTPKLLIFKKRVALTRFQEYGSNPDKHGHQSFFAHLATAVAMHFGVKHSTFG